MQSGLILKFSPVWLKLVVSETLLPEQSCPHVGGGRMFWSLSPHSWCSEGSLAGLRLFSPPLPPSFSIPALSLPSITPDCIWQMPLLAPYHQVQWRQPKTILLCPYTTSVLHFAWLTHLLLQGSNGAKALSVEQLRESQVPLAKGSPGECVGHGFQHHC